MGLCTKKWAQKFVPNKTPVAIETLGAIGPKSMVFLRELGRRIRAVTDEPKSADYLLQRISVAVQRGNSIAVQGSTGA